MITFSTILHSLVPNSPDQEVGVKKKLQQKQPAFGKGRGTTEQIFILRNIDFKKAFNSVRRDKLWTTLRNYAFLTTSLTSYKSFMIDEAVENGQIKNV